MNMNTIGKKLNVIALFLWVNMYISRNNALVEMANYVHKHT